MLSMLRTCKLLDNDNYDDKNLKVNKEVLESLDEGPSRETRPKLYRIIVYKLNEDEWHKGKVTAVGKSNGRYKSKC